MTSGCTMHCCLRGHQFRTILASFGHLRPHAGKQQTSTVVPVPVVWYQVGRGGQPTEGLAQVDYSGRRFWRVAATFRDRAGTQNSDLGVFVSTGQARSQVRFLGALVGPVDEQ